MAVPAVVASAANETGSASAQCKPSRRLFAADKPPGMGARAYNAAMLALLQRVHQASVTVEGVVVGAIGPGLLVLVAIEPGDTEAHLHRLAQRMLGYRIFEDAAGKMNRSLTDIAGGLLLVSQFTLAADTRSGMRPSFTTAAPPQEAERSFARLVEICREMHAPGVETGRFGAHMVVSLSNDGPATFLLRP